MSALVPVAITGPALLGGVQRTRVAVIANALDPAGDGFALPAERAPTETARAMLTEHRDALFNALRPAGKQVALELFTALLSVMSARGGDRTEMNMRAMMYVKAWQKVPLFALSKACDDAVDGVIGDGKWLPDPGVICLRAKTYWQCVDEEHALVSRVLDARVLPPVDRGTVEERKAIIARIRKATPIGPAPSPPVPEGDAAPVDPIPAPAAPATPSLSLVRSPLVARAGAKVQRAPAPRKRRASGRKARAP